MSGDRYISQNALIKEIAKIRGNLNTRNVGQAIWDTPTADVVEVVRCKDCKHKRGSENRDAIIEEMADCLIVIDQMGIIFDISDVELFEMYTQKVKRLEKRLEEESENAIT